MNGPRFVEEWLDLAPLAHERFKLVERVECLVPAEDHHAGATAPDAVDLSAMLLDMAVRVIATAAAWSAGSS